MAGEMNTSSQKMLYTAGVERGVAVDPAYDRE